MNRILCSTGAFVGRYSGYDYTLLKRVSDEVCCDGFEYMMDKADYDRSSEVIAFLKTLSKPVITFHTEKHVGDFISRNADGDDENALVLFEKNCIMAAKTGARLMVLHLWNGLDSDKDLPHNIRMFRALKDMADRYSLVLTVENVVCNTHDPMHNLRALLSEYNDIRFTFDTKMAEFHGQLQELYLSENKDIWQHISHIHVNDYRGGVMDWENLRTLHIGKGQIDFDSFFSFVKDNGYSGDFTIESTSFDKTGAIDTDSMNESIDSVRAFLR